MRAGTLGLESEDFFHTETLWLGSALKSVKQNKACSEKFPPKAGGGKIRMCFLSAQHRWPWGESKRMGKIFCQLEKKAPANLI